MAHKLLPAAGWGGEAEQDEGKKGKGEREKEKEGELRKGGCFTAGGVSAGSFNLFSEFTSYCHGKVF